MISPSITVVPQRHAMDCSVACLAMLLNRSYEEVLMMFRHNVIAQGATVRQVLSVAKQLGRPLHWTRKVDVEGTGILGVVSPKWPTEHLVVLKNGIVIDPDATVWELDDYLVAHEARAVSLMYEDD